LQRRRTNTTLLHRILCCLCIPVLWSACSKSQTQTAQSPVSSPDVRNAAALKSGILRGDPESMKTAAINNNRDMLPYLREQLKNSDKHVGGPAYTANIALAKMGETDQVQEIACELLGGDDRSQLEALEKLSWVGGYSSITLLDGLLSNAPSNEKIIDRISLRQRAAVVLGKLVPGLNVSPGVRMGIPPTEDQYHQWHDWLFDHRTELSQLQPSQVVTGDLSRCAAGAGR
jgi:hypothetical protein